MSDAKVKSPWHVWLIGVIAVLFNSVGVSAVIAGLLVFFSWYSWFMSVRGVLR